MPKVLKAGSAASDAQTTYNFIDLRQRCDDYVDRVRAQCRDWVAEAQAEADAIRKAAYAEGRQQGLKDGLADAAAQIQKQATTRSDAAIADSVGTALPALATAAREVVLQRDAWLRRWEEDAITLSLAVAERLTHATIAADPERLRDRLIELVRMAGGDNRVTVTMHPDDIAAVAKLKDIPSEIDFQPDPEFARGDATASTGEGLVDGRIAVQLEAIGRELLE